MADELGPMATPLPVIIIWVVLSAWLLYAGLKKDPTEDDDYYDENYSPIRYIKDIDQFGNVKYHANINSKDTISDLKLNNTLNIFSLLDYIEDNSPNIDNDKIIIQGNMIYNCSIKKISMNNEVIKYSIDFVPIEK